MRQLFIAILLIVIAMPALGQNLKTVDLRWKIGKKETVEYSTEMALLDSPEMEMGFGELFDKLGDSTVVGEKEMQALSKIINSMVKDVDYTTTLSTKDEKTVDIVMTSVPKEGKEGEIMLQMQTMSLGVMLRGSVYESGDIHSFWLKSRQKNLIALLFQLPSQPVKVGDKWSLDVNLIGNDQNFVCDSSYKVNEVTLIDIKKEKRNTIAVLKYNVIEYVDGTFGSSFMTGKDEKKIPSMMKMTHQGIAEFSIEKGRWISYNAIMSLETTGIMNNTSKTKYALVEK